MINGLSIKNTWLSFKCDVSELQEKIDQLIVASRLLGYSIDHYIDLRLDQSDDVDKDIIYFSLSVLKENMKADKVMVNFYYDNTCKFIKKVKFLYFGEFVFLEGAKSRAFYVDNIENIKISIDRIIKAI